MRIKILTVHLASFVSGCWLVLPALAEDWPQWLGPKHDAVWRETGILQAFPPTGPKVRWRTAIGGGYAGPAVSGRRVYVTDRVLGVFRGDLVVSTVDIHRNGFHVAQPRLRSGTTDWQVLHHAPGLSPR